MIKLTKKQLALVLAKVINREEISEGNKIALVKEGLIISQSNSKIPPLATAKGRQLLVDVLATIAEPLPLEKRQPDKKKQQVNETIERMKARAKHSVPQPEMDYWGGDEEDDDEEDDDEEDNGKKPKAKAEKKTL